MKKLCLIAAAGVLALSANANAHDSTGCGLGSLAWRGQQGPVAQVLAVTTNGLFGNQTFGISSGTSGCDPQGRITGGTQKMVYNFLENNMEQYAMDAAKGSGETLATLAGIMNVDENVLAEKTQQNFAVLFPNQDVDAVQLTLKLFEIIEA